MKSKTAHVAEEKESNNEENYAFLVNTDNIALVCTSDFHEEALKTGMAPQSIIIDCGASSHFMPDQNSLTNYQELTALPICAADSRTFPALGCRDMQIHFPMGNSKKPTPITLKNVYYSPHLAFTLISCSRMTRVGFKVLLNGLECKVYSPTYKVIRVIPEIHGLYRIGGSKNLPSTPTANMATNQIPITKFHRHMGHINHDDLKKMVKEGLVKGVDVDLNSTPEFCKTCIEAKAIQKPFPKESSNKSIKAYGDKIMADVWGPAKVKSIGRKKYALFFHDCHSHEECVQFMAKKSETFGNYKNYEAWTKVQRNIPAIKIFSGN